MAAEAGFLAMAGVHLNSGHYVVPAYSKHYLSYLTGAYVTMALIVLIATVFGAAIFRNLRSEDMRYRDADRACTSYIGMVLAAISGLCALECVFVRELKKACRSTSEDGVRVQSPPIVEGDTGQPSRQLPLLGHKRLHRLYTSCQWLYNQEYHAGVRPSVLLRRGHCERYVLQVPRPRFQRNTIGRPPYVGAVTDVLHCFYRDLAHAPCSHLLEAAPGADGQEVL